MTRILAASLLLATACGGDKDASSDADVGDTDTDTPIVDTDLCDGIPTFDLAGFNCDQITSAFEQTMTAARDCITVDDCHAESGQCTRFRDSGCWYPANHCVNAATVDVFADAWASCQGDDVCDCQGALELQCLNNTCAWIE